MPHAAIARGVTKQAHSSKVIKIPGHANHLAGKMQQHARHAAKHGKQQHVRHAAKHGKQQHVRHAAKHGKQQHVRHAAKHGKQQHQHTKAHKKQVKAGVPTETPTASATPSVPAPDLYIRQLRMGESHLDVGKKLTYVLFSGNTAGAASVSKQGSIVIMDVVPLGLTNLSVQGTHWKISLSDTVSPAVMTATYDGSYPVKDDTVLPPIFFAGTLTADAGPSITNTATIDAPNDTNALDSIVTDTVFVGANLPSTFVAVDDSSTGTPVSSTASATPSLTAVATVDLAATPSSSMTATATPAMTATAEPSATVAATPAMTATAEPSATVAVTPAMTATAEPSATVAATPAMTATATPSPTPLVTPTPAMTATATPSPTPSVMSTPMASPTSRVIVLPPSAPLTEGTATATAGATSFKGPDLTISISRPEAPAGDTYAVGQQVSYVLQVNNTQGPENQIVSVFDIAAVGISNVTFNAPGWTIGASNTVGPVALSGTFDGPYPIAAGASLPPITVSGILTSASGPLFSNAAAVTSNDDPNSSSNISVDSIVVQSAGSATATATMTPTAVGVATPTAAGATTATAVDVATPTIVAEVTSTATAVTTATSTEMPVATLPSASTSATMVTTRLNQSRAARSISKRKSGITLAIVNSNLYGNYALVHGPVKLALVVGNTGDARAAVHPSAIVVDEVIPLGLSHIQAQGKGWRISLSNTISPAIIHAQYIGNPALAPDIALPPISITGELNEEAVPILTSTAAASVPDVSDSDNITASDTLLVRNSLQQAR
ncbi:hypothetical protein KSZ_17630 [Dictyobacter formicarum]|uniref:DUF11 domain-containing protein n=2 Tax=Dictyobacter formicarum TaxID=2778368 RepID=A0ABQ3VC75_9CHLR|nr:hypothetical protein KSZ_17630 [Dictyobacter formicarum]